MSNSLIIFSGGNPWFQSAKNKPSDLLINPIGKGKLVKKNTTNSRASAKSESIIVNPIFKQMEMYCDDDFWKATFHDASIGKFHRGFRIDKETNLQYKIRNKIKTCTFKDLSVPDTIKVVKNFMQSCAGIMSSIDIENKNQELLRSIVSNQDECINSWSKIKIAQHKSILLADYISSVSEKLKLSSEEEEELNSVITFGIMTKRLNAQTIIVENSVIKHIDGLHRLDNGKFIINNKSMLDRSKCEREAKDIIIKPFSIVKGTINPQINVNLNKKWEKIINAVEKKNDILLESNTSESNVDSPDS